MPSARRYTAGCASAPHMPNGLSRDTQVAPSRGTIRARDRVPPNGRPARLSRAPERPGSMTARQPAHPPLGGHGAPAGCDRSGGTRHGPPCAAPRAAAARDTTPDGVRARSGARPDHRGCTRTWTGSGRRRRSGAGGRSATWSHPAADGVGHDTEDEPPGTPTPRSTSARATSCSSRSTSSPMARPRSLVPAASSSPRARRPATPMPSRSATRATFTHDGQRYLLTRSIARLVHEEHAPIEVPPGTWRVVIQREYEPPTATAAPAWRRVVD